MQKPKLNLPRESETILVRQDIQSQKKKPSEVRFSPLVKNMYQPKKMATECQRPYRNQSKNSRSVIR